MTDKTTPSKDFYIVGIGASAGGLEALESFFSNCPHDTGIAFVIVQHLSPDYKSMMSSLLGRHTKMPIKVTDNTDTIYPNHIYLIPGNKNLIVKNGKLELVDRALANQLNLPIDLFFESLAVEKKEKAIGIILSGTGSDGTRGGKVIKEVGGTLFVQDPETIRFDGMPLSAIENGIADYVLKASEIPYELLNYINFPSARTDWETQHLIDDKDAINEILQIIRRNTGYDFLPYRRQTLARRIIKRLKINKLEGLKEYIELLDSDINEQRTAVNEFLIGVTKFFRDTAAFKVLEKQVIPAIVKNSFKRRQDIKAWSVACSSGEEAYSVAMLIEETMDKLDMPVAYKVFATDVDSHAIHSASKGIYKEDIANDVPNALLNKYFIQKNSTYEIKSSIRKNIIFSKHDILQNPPFNKMDLISCRNMLIYLDSNAQKKALASLHFALKQHGYLFLGSSESLGAIQRSFDKIDRKSKIYKNIDASNRVFRHKEEMEMYTFSPQYNAKGTTLKEKFGYHIGQDLVEAVGAICIFINEKFDIIHAKGKLNKYFSLPEDGFSNNIMSVLPATLNIPISTSIRQINRGKHEENTIIKEVQYIKDTERLKLQIRVQEMPSTVQNSTFLVTILEVGKTILVIDKKIGTSSTEEVKKYQEEIKELHQALIDARENLQLTVEELETTNEEIQATNEELIASNEELQSTNEELQSVNEELHTVNAELQEKNLELLTLNSDMENLINSTNIGTLFLDKDCKIRRFTPAITEQLHLRESDIGRPVSDFSWHNLELKKEALQVLQTLQPLRREFQSKEGNWFLEQILPYRTQEDTIKGVVVNFINIDSIKEAIDEKEKANHFLEQVMSLSPGIIYVFDLVAQKFIYVNNSFEQILGYPLSEIERRKDFLAETVLPSYIEPLKKRQEVMKTAKDDASIFLEYQQKRLDGRITWISSIEKVFERNEQGEVVKTIGFALDNTAQMGLIERESENLHFINEITALSPDILYVYDLNKKKIDYSNRTFPRKLEDAPSNHPFDHLLHANDLTAYQVHLKKLQQSMSDASFYLELRIKDIEGNHQWMAITEKVFKRGDDQKVAKIIGTVKNIHANRQVQLKKEELDKLLLEINEVTAIIYILDVQKPAFEFMSKAVNKMLGYTSDEIQRMEDNYLEKLVYPADIVKMKKMLSAVTKSKNEASNYAELRLLHKEGKPIWVEMIQKVFETNKKGEPTKVIGLCQEITQRKNNQIALKESNEKLERFAYISSHDLKEPLNTIISALDLMKMEINNQEVAELLQPIEDSTTHMKNLIEDLLDYSILNKKPLQLQPTNLNKILKEVKQDLDASIKSKKARLKIGKLPVIHADKTLMKQAFQNLIGNSIKYNDKKIPIIEIMAEERSKDFVLSVKDNGIGIDKKYYTKIFDVFKTLHNRDQYSGTGIGLASCKSIVQSHKGKIWVESILGKGSTFYFTIPKLT